MIIRVKPRSHQTVALHLLQVASEFLVLLLGEQSRHLVASQRLFHVLCIPYLRHHMVVQHTQRTSLIALSEHLLCLVALAEVQPGLETLHLHYVRLEVGLHAVVACLFLLHRHDGFTLLAMPHPVGVVGSRVQAIVQQIAHVLRLHHTLAVVHTPDVHVARGTCQCHVQGVQFVHTALQMLLVVSSLIE